MEQTLFRNILWVIRLYKYRFSFAALLMLLANLLLIANPLIFRLAIERGVTNPWPWAALLLTFALISSLFRYRMRIEFSTVSREVEREMRKKIFERIQSQSREFYDRHGVGELIERISSDMGAYRDVLGPGLLFPVYFITIMIPGLLALFWISPMMGLITLIPIILIPLMNKFFRKQMYELSSEIQAKLGELGSFVQEDFSGIRIVKSYANEAILLNRFGEACQYLFGLNFKLMCLQGSFFPLLSTLTRIATIFLVIVAGLLVLAPADFVSFMWIQSYIFFPVMVLGWVIPLWQQGRASYDRLKILYEEPNVVKGSENNEIIPASASIEFNNLNFSYLGQKPLFEDFSLKIEGGTMVGLSGPTGGGKTTLFKLLNREYEIPVSMILIGGKDIHDYPLSAFWEEIVSVDQIPFLFSKTIKENVGFGKDEFSLNEIYGASELADLHETVMGFEKGYETIVGEKGVTLSGGQKSRVAIARAFLVNKSILLLDDIFAPLDNQTGLKIFDSIQSNFKGKTILITTSKVSILERLDRVVFIKEGKIVEQGTPQELLEIKGRFYALKELESLSDA